MRTVKCPECNGDGMQTYFTRGGFSSDYGNYLPDERRDTCDRCDGYGQVEIDEEAHAD